MKIANIGYQANYSNNKSNEKVISKPVQFKAIPIQAAVSEPVKKIGTFRTLAKIVGLKIKNIVAPADVKTVNYVASEVCPIIPPQNVKALKDIYTDGFRIQGKYEAGAYARIMDTIVAENGSLSTGTHLSAFDSLIKGAADTKGNAYVVNTKLAKGGHLNVGKDAYFYDGSKAGGTVIAGQKVVFRRGSELSKGGVSNSDELFVSGPIKGHAVSREVTVYGPGSVEKKGEIWAEHVHFDNFLPEEGRVTAEKITIGHPDEPRFTFTKPEDVPQNYRSNITIKNNGWYKTFTEFLGAKQNY